MPTYSVSFRLRRITTEYGYVSVPITDDLIITQADGTGRIDTEKMVERAIALGNSPGLMWREENREVGPHPTQQAPENGSDQ